MQGILSLHTRKPDFELDHKKRSPSPYMSTPAPLVTSGGEGPMPISVHKSESRRR